MKLSTLAGLFFALGAGPAGAATLTEMDYTSLPGNEVQINFSFDEAVSKPKTFKTSNPARVALDFRGANNGLSERAMDIGVGAVTGVSTAEAGGRTRAVVKLSDLVPYDVSVDGRIVQMQLKAPGSSGSGSTASASGSTSRSGSSVGSGGDAGERSITSIDFRRGEDGSGKLIVGLSDASVPVDITTSGGEVIADFADTKVPERLRRRLDVTDFATPVKSVTTRQRGSSVRMNLDPVEDATYDQIAYQADKSFTIELKPLTEEEKQRKQEDEFQYTGERLSLNFQDIQVRSVLQLIADFTGINIVVSDSVSGNITLRLKDVPWDQALAIILRSKGLDKRKRGNVMWIAPAQEIAEREQQRAKAREKRKDLAPLRSEFLRVNYAKASQLASLVQGDEGSRRLLSERGSISVDQRTNTLILRDTEANLEDVRRLVNRLDVPVRQVEIESRVVLATSDFTSDLGVNFGYSQNDDDAVGSTGATVGGRQTGSTDFGDVTAFEQPGGSGNEGLITALPVNNAAGSLGLAVGTVGSDLLQLELQAMESENRGKIVSTPKVVTANQKEAFIEEGEEIPFTSSDGDDVTTEFKEAFLRLSVTPQITPDDRVLMDLEVSNDSRGSSTPNGPAIDTQALGTQVLVDNGETIVLGGVYERTKQDGVDRVPFFGELPVVGNLFKRTTEVDEDRELLIFVTPKIRDEQVALEQ